MPDGLQRLIVEVSSSWIEASGIRAYRVESCDGQPLPAFTPGAHIGVFLPSGRIRQYSIANDPMESDHYILAVQREERGRGGSLEMHDAISAGTRLAITMPINNFPLADQARRHVLVAGGIGITPFMAMIYSLQRQGKSWHLHYCSRTAEKSAFLQVLQKHPYAAHTTFHHDNGDPAKSVDLTSLLRTEAGAGTHVYCCGPKGLMDGVRAATTDWPLGTVHFEYFAASSTPESQPKSVMGETAFEVELARSGQVFAVPPGSSILSVLESQGIEVPSLCTEGICGTCIVDVLEGEPDHRDYVLDERDRIEGRRIALCCSRARSKRLKIDL